MESKTKGLAALILMGRKPKGDKKREDAEDGMDSDYEAALHDAAESALQAVKDDDVDAFKEALHDFFKACESAPHDDKEADEEDSTDY